MQLWPDNGLCENLKIRRWFVVGLVLLAVLLTGPGVGAYYTGEALQKITARDWGISASLFSAIVEPHRSGYYRPLMERVFTVGAYEVFGTDPLIPRAFRFGLYALTCVLVFLILEALSQSFLTAAVGAVIFTIMPSHVEPVFQMVSPPVYSVFFSMLTLWLAGPSFRKKASWLKSLFASVAFIAGLLTYPDTFMVVIPMLIAYELLWGLGGGRAALKKRLIRAQLPLWTISVMYLGLRFYQFMSVGDAAGAWIITAKGLTVASAAKRMIPIVYGIIRPLQLSPALCVAAFLLLWLGCRAKWRLTLFLLLWTVVTPALNYGLVDVLPRRVYLASFGMAGLLAHLPISCLGGALEHERRRPLVVLLEWVTVIAVGYWVFELLNMGWAELFSGQGLTRHLRFFVAPIAAIALAARCALTRSLRPKLSIAPLRFLSFAVLVLIVGFYAGGFLRAFGMFMDESEQAAQVPKAIVAAQPTVPDNAWILIVLPDSIPVDSPLSPPGNIQVFIRAEYGKNLEALFFRSWVRDLQRKAIRPNQTVLAFRFDGQRAVKDPVLAERVVGRQKSYMGLSFDVIHARAVAASPGASQLHLNAEVDTMLIDRLDLQLRTPASQATVQLEFTANGRPVELQLSARIEGTRATVRLAQQPLWMLAGKPGQVSVSVLAGAASLPIRQAAFVQTAGLISESPGISTLPPISPPSATLVRLTIMQYEIDRCIALP